MWKCLIGGAPRAVFVCFAFAVISLKTTPVAWAQSLVARTSPVLAYPEKVAEPLVVDVVVALAIDESGQVVEAEVVMKEPPDSPTAFDDAALEFTRALAFESVVVDGEVRRINTEISLRFEPPGIDDSGSETDREPGSSDAASPARASFTQRVQGAKVPLAGGSDFHIHVGKLADVPRADATQMLTLAPGILLTNHGGAGHAPSVFLRGFDAGEGQDLEFRLDGVPLNEVSNSHGHGYADVHFIIPELVDELRVTQGPFDPRQGDFAVAGSAEYRLALRERGLQAKATTGSYGAWRGLVMFGPTGEEDGTFAAVEMKKADGFGVNRASAGVSAMAQYEARPTERTRLVVLGHSYSARFDAAGVLRQDDFDARRLPCASDEDSQFFCTHDENQGGASSRHGLSVRLVKRLVGATLEQQLFWSTRHLRLRENFTGLVNDTPRDGQPQRGDGSEKLYDATTFGLRGSLAFGRMAFGRRQHLEVGYSARYDAGDTASRRLRAAGGEPYAVDFDNGFGIGHVGVYAATRLRLTDDLTLQGGVRADAFSFSVVDRNRPESDRAGKRLTTEARDAFGTVFQPRATLQYRLAKGLDWVASFGTGARSSDASALSDGESAPFSAVRAAETGVLLDRAFDVGDGLTAQGALTAYATRVERSFVFDEASMRNELIGASNRFGALASVRTTYAHWLDAQASTTYAEAYLPTEGASWWQLNAGVRLPYVPRWVNRLDAAVRRTNFVGGEQLEWGMGLGLTHIAPRPLPLGKVSDPIFTIDASARARWKWVEASVDATNLLDSRYRLDEFNYASNFGDPSSPPSLRAARHFSAGPPRMVSVSLAFHFDVSSPGSVGGDVDAVSSETSAFPGDNS